MPSSKSTSNKPANLGVMLGVYLPTIQHILGVTMFIRLSWCVGVAGIWQTCVMLGLCCICTFLTCISISAVATNGVMKGGGAYYIISKNLGPEFGSAVGILFYLANTVAIAMYLVGGVEILLLYIFPELTIGGVEVQTETHPLGMMSHNFRIYGTLLLLMEFAIVAMGVKFVQMVAPISLITVIVSILACFAGSVEKTINPSSGQNICLYGEHLLQASTFLPKGANIADICTYCNVSNPIFMSKLAAADWTNASQVTCKSGYPGYHSDAFSRNFGSLYPGHDEFLPGKLANRTMEIFQDHSTTFFHLLAIYFPAVTGILTGTNMSGDLKDPKKSIPSGTIAAQITTSFIYFALAIVFGASISPELLRDKNGLSLNGGMVVAELAWPNKWVLLLGSFLSTFGAALQCLCTAPRLLQGIAKDNVIPVLAPFSKLTKNNEPFHGLIITTIIAELAILMGGMDNIAAVVDFFFLMCYAFVNLICALHSLLGAPSWHWCPSYPYYHWSMSLLGAFLCFFIMFSTHWDYAVISCILCATIYKYVEWKGAKKEWGDGIRGLALSTAQYSLMKFEDEDNHSTNWRPQILILHSISWSKELIDIRYLNLLNLASQMKADRGLTIVVSCLRGDPNLSNDQEAAKRIKERVQFDIKELRLRGFAKTLVYKENQFTGSLHALIQSIGIGGLRPNTLLLSWPTRQANLEDEADSEYQTFCDKIITGNSNGMCMIVAKGITEFPSRVKLDGFIDVYWICQESGLCLLFGYLLKQSKVWRRCKLRIIVVAHDNEIYSNKLKADLRAYISALHIDAQITIVELNDPEISKTAFERTLLMEERTRFMQQMRQRPMSKASSTDEAMDEIPLDEDDHSDKPLSNITSLADRQRIMNSLDRSKVYKTQYALRLNEIILENSTESQMVLLKLPKPEEALEDYIQYLEVLSNNVKRILFVRGSGAEIISTGS